MGIQPGPLPSGLLPGDRSPGIYRRAQRRRTTTGVPHHSGECLLPVVYGRFCHHPCEAACNRGKADEHFKIRASKRFAADSERIGGKAPERAMRVYRERIGVFVSGRRVCTLYVTRS
ncbi:MAG: hypothetical protein A3K30_07250 [Deltaproteobacteria bacterium RBG_13_51_10]|nr:MAG: hypothetical protein A3K30_07250 [Deltaproteobacteria bacterium RBG_13_51_10]